MAWICYKAHTCDKGAHCMSDMTFSHVTKVEKIKTGRLDESVASVKGKLEALERWTTWR